jgi:hypothetical protein
MTRKNNNDKRSFVMYDSFLEAMKHLNDVEFRECVLKIRDYALEGIEEESEYPMVNVIMSLAKPNLDSARRRYMASVENGKKGAEFGELGGAPKGNKNASKKQPLKQPLNVDVDDNEDAYVDVYVYEDVNIDADVNADATITSTGLKSSFTSSIQESINQIENDSDQFEEQEEREEPHNEAYSHCSNDCSVGAANENTGEALSSKVDSSSAARPQQREEGGMSEVEYMRKCYERYLSMLVDMRLGRCSKDDNVFYRAIDLYVELIGCSREQAIERTNQLINEWIRKRV